MYKTNVAIGLLVEHTYGDEHVIACSTFPAPSGFLLPSSSKIVELLSPTSFVFV